MAISFQKENQIFTIDTKNTTYQMKISKFGHLLHLYYGAKIQGNMDYILSGYHGTGFSGNPHESKWDRSYSLDLLPQEYPCLGTGDYRSKALVIQNADGSECCDLRYVEYEIQKGKYALSGLPAVYATAEEAETLAIILEDSVSHIQVKLLYGVLEQEDVITRSAIITNFGDSKVVIEKASSACLDFINGTYDLISFYGKHVQERMVQRSEILHGTMSVGSRRGASSHHYNPTVILADPHTTEDSGACYGMAFVFSGSFLFEVEKDQFDQTRAIMGLQPEQFHYALEPLKEFIVPETILTFTENGFSALTQTYHNCIRNHIIRGKYQKKVRPVLINSWEASYFNFNGDTIVQLAKDSAELGIDLVVMDDGWFGYRNDDNTSLGDWTVNEEKLGCSLGTLIQKINDLGVEFGIWFEPEMISEDSNLYREHPDWALQIPGRKPILSRNQLVLDFSREEVRNYIFESMCRILDQGNIFYVKWDMNRSLDDIYSKTTVAGNVLYDYVLGVYDFLEKLTQKYPNLLIEGCSGGGGRFDVGMMYYTPQIWCSDNTDAIDRTRIQYGSSFFYPISVMGSHVSAVPNHQTARMTKLNTRGIVAMSGTFGYEMNPHFLSDREKEEIKAQIQTYKKYAELVQTGSYYRLSNPFTDTYAAWLLVSEDQKKALLSVVVLNVHGNKKAEFIKLKGMLPNQNYREMKTGKVYNTSALAQVGVLLPTNLWEYEACQMEFEMVE